MTDPKPRSTKKNPAAREPWDYETFIRHYDAIARERGGWRFDREGYTPPEKLEAWYREGGALFDSLYDFAHARFTLEQQM